jgi:hypothetical protein
VEKGGAIFDGDPADDVGIGCAVFGDFWTDVNVE